MAGKKSTRIVVPADVAPDSMALGDDAGMIIVPVSTPARATMRTPTRTSTRTKGRQASSAIQVGLEFTASDDLRCGVDEAGRGPLAGPVVAAAVILDPSRPIDGLDDSKALSPKVRERLYHLIVERALSYSVAEASVEEIDTINILQATMLAMRRAVEGLSVEPQLAQIDGNRCPQLRIRSEAIIGGDALVQSISAASILAKVTRDRMLHALHDEHPMYGFDAHVGYGTRQHLEALRQHGPCIHHRRSFAPVREAWARLTSTS